MLEFYDIFIAVCDMFIKKVFRNEKLFAMTTLEKKSKKNNTHVFKRIDFKFSRMTHDFRINIFFIEN